MQCFQSVGAFSTVLYCNRKGLDWALYSKFYISFAQQKQAGCNENFFMIFPFRPLGFKISLLKRVLSFQFFTMWFHCSLGLD